MNAEQLVREGKLDEALSSLQDQVRKDPSSAKLRIFLFQLLAVRGDWDRAMNQLGVAKELDPQSSMMAQVCGQAIQCESLRHDVFAGARTPLVFGEPSEWVGKLIHAAKLLAEGHITPSADMRDEAFEGAPAIGGSIDGTEFEWIADADTRLGPVFEAVIEGKYYWIPMESVRRVSFDPPEDLRDAVWSPASFLWTNGGHSVALVPSRYPGSDRSSDDAVRLARKTEFAEPGEGHAVGVGQRMFATDQGEFALLATREIILGGPLEQEEVAALARAEGRLPPEPDAGAHGGIHTPSGEGQVDG